MVGKQGLTDKEWKQFMDLLIKANTQQLKAMTIEVYGEIQKRPSQ